MDFNDVFGGPPKRFSIEETTSSCLWSEKPVFGEEVRSRRRQNVQGGDEFFNDIFKGVESYPSPRRRSSNSTSRVMSPLPPKLDHFPNSLPAHLSLPSRVSKGMELPTFGCSSPLSSGRRDEEMRDESSHDKDKTENSFNHFHFSIYKWAGRGVPMLSDFKSNHNNSSSNGRWTNDIKTSNQSVPAEPVRTRHMDKLETKDTVVLEEEIVPMMKKKTETIHAFLNEGDHQEMKDLEKPKTPRVDEMRNRKVERSSSLKLREMSEKKKSVEKGNVKEFVEAKDKKSADVSFKVVEDLNKHQTKPTSQPCTNSKISVENADDPLDDNFMVEEIFDAQESIAETESSDDTKAIDAKIRQWSVGKKGNIRSLLSTLQYVLWAGSGWKAVPLVDLIEANSVKRAYQKALLRLHPDKLQQKAASFHHKYTAEKVFDILQEAWDHFNTSSLST